MKLFNIYIKKSDNTAIEDLVMIKSGFSFPAFFLNVLWFLQHKMWKEFFSLVIFNIILITLFQKNFFGDFDFFALELGFLLVVALNANYWYEQYLRQQNYQFTGCVFGKNKDEAKLRFISNYFKDQDQNTIFCPSILDTKNNNKGRSKFEQYFTI
jgi:hypothetical protein